ncbi:MAG: peptidoglycan DD-metalloendopeptidase family protein [Clostridia bacterium]|nr:peptidoglycan DD-metalloendopeptidase family protein [Clostridia bacterium]
MEKRFDLTENIEKANAAKLARADESVRHEPSPATADKPVGGSGDKRFKFVALAALAVALIVVSALLYDAAPAGVADSALPTRTPAAVTPSPAPSGEPEPSQAQYVRTSIAVDGEIVATLASREAAEAVLDDVLEHYALLSQADAAHSQFVSEVELRTAAYSAAVLNSEEAYILLTSAETPVRVQSRTTRVTTVSVQHEVLEVEDSNLMRGMRVFESLGRDGIRGVTVQYVFENGALSSETVLSEEVISEVHDTVILVGTLEPRDGTPGRNEGSRGISQGELRFASPVDGVVSLNFGRCNYGFHQGLDYEADEGTDVTASCGGTVICAMERGGMGLVVELDHGDGFVTRYAHLGEILVEVGDEVASGDVIGLVGATGNCDAPHLHFELRIFGRAYNPRYYLD